MVRKLVLGLALAGAALLPFSGAAEAGIADGVVASHPFLQLMPVEKTQFFFGGRNYCFYYDGWHGPGFYWCGYAYREGLGYGGGEGWNGWRGGGGGRRDGHDGGHMHMGGGEMGGGHMHMGGGETGGGHMHMGGGEMGGGHMHTGGGGMGGGQMRTGGGQMHTGGGGGQMHTGGGGGQGGGGDHKP